MYSKLRYGAILAKPTDWPIVQLSKQKDLFLETVANKVVEDILSTQSNLDLFRLELAQSLTNQQKRLQKLIWKVDKKSNTTFFASKIAALQDLNTPLATLLKDISLHYVHEIAGDFNLWHYKMGEAAASYTLNRLLNPFRASYLRSLKKIRASLQQQIEIIGAVDELRELVKQGTIVMVPTHCSHFDSVLIWWVIAALGLPSFMYGAGLNLFNSRFFGYFMQRLGTFKIDRRKKDIIYLMTLKAYSSIALHWGCHSLFYPGGTRSRSGALEESLKVGLLSTVLDAQQMNYAKSGQTGKKIFIVPVVFNYHFVLEAPFLVRDYLASEGLAVNKGGKKFLQNVYKIFKLIKKFATKGSSITVSIGQAMDVAGNQVDMHGKSYNQAGELIDTYSLLQAYAEPINENIAKEHLKTLSHHILAAYRKENCVISSYLLAFAAFKLIQKNHPTSSLQELASLTNHPVIPYQDLVAAVEKLQQALKSLALESKIRLSTLVEQATADQIIQDGLANLGLYHQTVPLIKDKEGDVVLKDVFNLFFYHNRLTGYELEKQFTK